MTVRITGSLTLKNYDSIPNYLNLQRNIAGFPIRYLAQDLFKHEFGTYFKTKGPPFIKLPLAIEVEIKQTLKLGIELLSEVLVTLPFKILYAFL